MSWEIYVIRKNNRLPRAFPDYYQWLHKEIDKTDPSLYDDSNILRNPLRKFYKELSKKFPALNGRDRTEDDTLIDRAVDYCFTQDAIEVSCGYQQVEEVYNTMSELARKYGLCLYYVTTFELYTTPKKTVLRHTLDDYPSIPKAFVRSLPELLFSTAFILGFYYFFRLLPESDSIPPIGSIYPWIIILIDLVLCIFLLLIGIRNERRGKRQCCEIEQ